MTTTTIPGPRCYYCGERVPVTPMFWPRVFWSFLRRAIANGGRAPWAAAHDECFG